LAADGEGALELVRNERPELVLLDVMMPRLSGYKVCEQIKAIESGIYVILLTAKGQALDKVRGREAGADEYVTKPFDPDYIVERAVKVLGLDF
jgi:two-component system alkaline phosphatase synthesis response regulator PhoP